MKYIMIFLCFKFVLALTVSANTETPISTLNKPLTYVKTPLRLKAYRRSDQFSSTWALHGTDSTNTYYTYYKRGVRKLNFIDYLPLTAGSSYPLTGTLVGTDANFSGKIGIGTVSPVEKLEVTGNIRYTGALFAPDGVAVTPSIRFYNSASGLYYPGSDALGIVAGGVERMRLTYAGNIGVGTTTPEVPFSISGAAAEPASSGTVANSFLQLKSALNNEMNFGLNTVGGNYGGYIQVSDNNLAVPYGLYLQPTGGRLGLVLLIQAQY